MRSRLAVVALGQLQQVADVVEQRGRHDGVGGAGRPGQRRGLLGVGELEDLLVVALGAVALEERQHLVDGRGGHVTGRPWKSPISDTAEPSPSSARFCS